MTTREMIRAGEFNNVNCETLADGSQMITATKRGDPVRYKLHIWHINEPDEAIIRDWTERATSK